MSKKYNTGTTTVLVIKEDTSQLENMMCLAKVI
jgi:hypothetical protein